MGEEGGEEKEENGNISFWTTEEAEAELVGHQKIREEMLEAQKLPKEENPVQTPKGVSGTPGEFTCLSVCQSVS